MLLENLKINYNPLVLVNTLFNIVNHDTSIKGYWLDNAGKLYIDNIELLEYPAIRQNEFYNKVSQLFSQGEKCIAFKNTYNELVIQYPIGTKVLKKRIAWIENIQPSREYITALLLQHNGLTIYLLDNKKYLIEIYK